MAENEEELLMKVKEESENADLKLNIQKLRSWHLLPSLHGKQKGEKVETVTYFLFLGSQIIVDSDWNHEIKMFASWEESYNKTRQHIKKAETSFYRQRSV